MDQEFWPDDGPLFRTKRKREESDANDCHRWNRGGKIWPGDTSHKPRWWVQERKDAIREHILRTRCNRRGQGSILQDSTNPGRRQQTPAISQQIESGNKPMQVRKPWTWSNESNAFVLPKPEMAGETYYGEMDARESQRRRGICPDFGANESTDERDTHHLCANKQGKRCESRICQRQM